MLMLIKYIKNLRRENDKERILQHKWQLERYEQNRIGENGHKFKKRIKRTD